MLMRRPARLGRLLSDRRGAAAVEFALIAPVLILLYFGLSELSSGIIAARHTNQSSASLGDLVAQCSNINDSDVANIFSAASDILAPLPVTTLKSRVSSIIQTTSNPSSTVVQWSRNPAGQTSLLQYNLLTPIPLPPGLTTNQNDTVIMSETTYKFNFPIDLFNNLIQFDDVSYYKPRKSQQVQATWSVANGGNATNTSCYSS